MIDKLTAQANSLSGSGDFQGAIKLLEKYLENNPGQQDILLLLGKNCIAAGEHTRTEKVFRAIADTSDDPETLRAFGNMLYTHGETAQAVAVYLKFLELRPKNRAIWKKLVVLYLDTGDVEAAIDCFYRVIALEPDNTDAHAELSRLLFSRQRADEATELLAGILKIKPDDHELCFLYAGLLAHSGKYGEALIYSTRAFRGAPSNTGYRLRLSDILERLGEPDKTFDVLKPLLEDRNVPLDAVRIFARISPALRMKYEAGLLIDYISGRDDIPGAEEDMIKTIRDWLARS